MKIHFRLLVVGLAFLAINANATVFTNLYSFSATSFNNPALGAANGGYSPQADLLLSSNVLYGTTALGGSNNVGTVFAINDNEYNPFGGNTTITNLHTFAGSDGANPEADLVLSGHTLYGTTAKGGAYGGGTVFAVNTVGIGFTNLFSFAYTNGGNPQAGMVLSGNTLYGTTTSGGAYGAGTVFAIQTNGTGFTTLFNFNYTNGANPEADLLLLGNILYGTTVNGGGSNGWGTVFAINTNGTGFTNLFTFTLTNGANPQAGLALVSNVLCGTTVNGGTNGAGIVFSVMTNGQNFAILYNFSPNSFSDGLLPYSSLAVVSNGASSYTLCGTTEDGGDHPPFYGIVFALSINISGPGLTVSSYSVLHNFGNFSGDYGQSPVAGLVLSGNMLYGTTEGLGGYSEGGNLFAIQTSGNNYTQIHYFNSEQSYTYTNSDGAGSLAGLVLSGNTLYGTAPAGGVNGDGTVFTVNIDGTGFTNLYNLNGSWASLILSGDTLYGTETGAHATGEGAYGSSTGGGIFTLNTDGTGYTNLFSFNISDGGFPEGNLILCNNTLYGTTAIGGSGYGTVFAVNTNETDFTNLYNFNYTTGFQPICGLALSGNTLYGTTAGGGSNLYGTVFAINTDGTGFTNLHTFNGADGNFPRGNLVLFGDTLYGTTRFDVNRGCGMVFAVNTDGTGFTNLYNFSGSDGANPLGNLALSGNTLYGTTSVGGSGGYGTVFAINTDGTGFTNLYNFSGGNDGAAPYDGLLLSGNTLYGTTSSGGSGGNGTVFALSLGPIPLNVQLCNGGVMLTWGNPAFSLQAAPTVNGAYTNVPGAASPYTNAITGSQQFFRLQAN